MYLPKGIKMNLSDFDYKLPQELIAQEAISDRSRSRLLYLNRANSSFEHRFFYDIVDLIPADTLLVMNNTKVIPARIICRKPTGGEVEVFLTRNTGNDEWECMLKPAKKVSLGAELSSIQGELHVVLLEKYATGLARVKVFYNGNFWDNLSKSGVTPLPPYIKKTLPDPDRYQTVYAKEKGSVAAPTAGLHFTDEILARLSKKGVEHVFLTLHVGPGTFRPVKCDNIKEHVMDYEYYTIPPESSAAIECAIKDGRQITAVGTTSVRTLESAYDEKRNLTAPSGSTNLFIFPGYKFKMVDALITNFHLPKSTLLMLVSSFAGRDFVMEAYKEAVKERYRMYSLGDAMFIL